LKFQIAIADVLVGRFTSDFSAAAAMDQNLEIIYQNCVQQLDCIDPVCLSNIQFDFDGTQNWLCSRRLPTPLCFDFCSSEPVTSSPVIFHVVGQISKSKPIIESHPTDVTSFWIEPRSDTISRTIWSRIPQSIEAVTQAAKVTSNSSELYETDSASGTARLRMVWAPVQDVWYVSNIFRRKQPSSY
jgi:hypothetical protein